MAIEASSSTGVARRIRLGMVGGGQGAFIGADAGKADAPLLVAVEGLAAGAQVLAGTVGPLRPGSVVSVGAATP